MICLNAKTCGIVIFVFLSLINHSYAQEFKSSTTAYSSQNYVLEFIERSIVIKPTTIVITSKGKEKTDIQTLTINNREDKPFGNFGICTWYYCTTKNLPGSEKVVIVPKTKPIEQINIFEPILNGASSKNIKILVESSSQ